MAKHHLRLGVNIDHVATIRNARGSPHPDPLRAAVLAEAAGARMGRPRAGQPGKPDDLTFVLYRLASPKRVK